MEKAELRELAEEFYRAVVRGSNPEDIGDHLRHFGTGLNARALGEEISSNAPHPANATPQMRAARLKVRDVADALLSLDMWHRSGPIASRLKHHGINSEGRAFGYELDMICRAKLSGLATLKSFEDSKKALAVELGKAPAKPEPSQAVLACFRPAPEGPGAEV